MVAGWEAWKAWELRGLILTSLGLQILLIFLAPLRKRDYKVSTLIWFAYLLAEVNANFVLGLINSRSQGQTCGPSVAPPLLAFWAPFLLVHLGGPDTITAFALEDNELWHRHLLVFAFECLAVAHAFFQSFPNNKLWVPTVLMFAVGVIKYIERTRALYLASSSLIKKSLLKAPDPGPNYEKLMNEYTSMVEAGFPTTIEMIPEPRVLTKMGNTEDPAELLSDLEVVQDGHYYFTAFKGLIADAIFSFRERNQSRDFFLKRTATDAFKVVEVELNFFYEILYTKATVVQSKLGFPFRILSFSLNCAALVLFYLEKKEFEKLDIGISYTLLLGSIALDLIASVVVLYSDWLVVALTKSDHPNRFIEILRTLLTVDRGPRNLVAKPRWSESLRQFNFFNYCLHPRTIWWETTIGVLGLTNILNTVKYGRREKFTNDLRELIFKELKMKSELAVELEIAKEIVLARGDWTLRNESCTDLLRWISEVDFDESLILWHIATELCYYTDQQVNSDKKHLKVYRKLSKLLSNYLLYLLIMESKMLSSVEGIARIRFTDTCAEARKFFREREIGKYGYQPKMGQDTLVEACESILDVTTVVEPVTVKGDRSKSALFDACMLAKELKKLERSRMWQIISKVWVELMSYAACHSRANAHMAQLQEGGELLTFVRFLMAHLGLGDQFRIREGHARAKLIVTK